MKARILLTICGVSFFLCASSQKITTAYAITSEATACQVWTEVKLINMNTGEVVQNVFQSKVGDFSVYEARTGKAIKIKDEKGVVTDNNKLPFSTFSAACAYDKRHNRLYYTPMFINQLRYIDLNGKSPSIYYFENENLTTAANPKDETNHVTRMVIGADGNGYALTNDGSHLVRFTTGRRAVITDLGALNDDESNKVSLRTKATSFGGDMVADAAGNLFLITAHRQVFKIDISKRIAKHLGVIGGLPSTFTTNGAAVDNDGNLIVTSANSQDAYYRVDMKTWEAKKIDTKGKVLNASDLANSNLASTEQVQSKVPNTLFTRSIIRNDRISVYPNPVQDGVFRVTFHRMDTGPMEIQLVDQLGRIVSAKKTIITGPGQVEEVAVSARLAHGLYLVKVVNGRRKAVYADKIVLD